VGFVFFSRLLNWLLLRQEDVGEKTRSEEGECACFCFFVFLRNFSMIASYLWNNKSPTIKISHLAIDSTESLQHDQNYSTIITHVHAYKEINKPKSQPKTAVSLNVNAHQLASWVLSPPQINYKYFTLTLNCSNYPYLQYSKYCNTKWKTMLIQVHA